MLNGVVWLIWSKGTWGPRPSPLSLPLLPKVALKVLQGNLGFHRTQFEKCCSAHQLLMVQRIFCAISALPMLSPRSCLPFQFRYNVLTQKETQSVYDVRYYGGQCETVYNGEWRELRYDPTCERLYYGDDEKYFRKPYNFLKYHFEVSLNRGAHRPLGGCREGKLLVEIAALLWKTLFPVGFAGG